MARYTTRLRTFLSGAIREARTVRRPRPGERVGQKRPIKQAAAIAFSKARAKGYRVPRP